MLLRIHPENPGQRNISTVVECFKDGGVVIFPTDTIYAMGCDIYKTRALDRVAQIKGIRIEKANFSFLCHDLSQLSDFTKPIGNEVFKLMKRTLPGPFTYILNANNNVPRLFQSKKKTVGIRIPDNKIITEIIRQLGNPLTSSSIHDEDEIIEYTTDPELIYEKYEKLVDIVIDGGFGDNEPSTIIDCTSDEIIVVREGKGRL